MKLGTRTHCSRCVPLDLPLMLNCWTVCLRLFLPLLAPPPPLVVPSSTCPPPMAVPSSTRPPPAVPSSRRLPAAAASRPQSVGHLAGRLFRPPLTLLRLFRPPAGYLQLLRPVLSLSAISLAGCLGASLQLCLMQDLLSMLTLHIYCFYVYAARWAQLDAS